MPVLRSGIPRSLARLVRDSDGVSAVEFALLLPLILTLLAGAAEVTRAIDNYRKVTLLARTVADLTAQGDTVSPIAAATMADILASSSLVLAPFKSTTATIVVSAMGAYPSTLGLKPYVCSSVAGNAAARKSGAAATDITVPPQFQTAGMRYVLAEVTMPYAPVIGATVTAFLGSSLSTTFSVRFAWPPRGGATFNSTYSEVVLPGGSACPSTAS